MKIKDLPKQERPYEKLENRGAETLSDAELIAIIIKTGTKEKTAIEIAQEILKKDYEEQGIGYIKNMSLEEIQEIKGIGTVKSIQLKALAEIIKRASTKIPKEKQQITSPKDISDMFMAEMKDLKKEIIKTVLLNNKNEVIRTITNAIGTLNTASLQPCEIYKEPIKSSAPKIIMIHNHPSGDPTPSTEDIKTTQRMHEIGKMLGIELVDHIIIGQTKYTSLKSLKKF